MAGDGALAGASGPAAGAGPGGFRAAGRARAAGHRRGRPRGPARSASGSRRGQGRRGPAGPVPTGGARPTTSGGRQRPCGVPAPAAVGCTSRHQGSSPARGRFSPVRVLVPAAFLLLLAGCASPPAPQPAPMSYAPAPHYDLNLRVSQERPDGPGMPGLAVETFLLDADGKASPGPPGSTDAQGDRKSVVQGKSVDVGGR